MGSDPRPAARRGVTMVITNVRPADLARISELEGSCFGDPWSRESFRQLLATPTVFFRCVREDVDAPALGYVVAWFVADEGEIANLAVDPALRRRGVGGALLDASLAEAAQRGAAAVYLEVRESNTAARRLYASRGFVEVGRRTRYYRKPVEDAVVLRCAVAEPAVESKR